MCTHPNTSRTPALGPGPSGLKALSLCAALGSLAAVGAARADSVNLTFAGAGLGQNVQATLGAQSWNVFAGRLLHGASGGTGGLASAPSTVTTFCVDLMQGHASGPSLYGSASVSGLASSGMGLSTLGAGKQQAIYDLYQAAGDLQFTQFSGFAAAFQLAVWEVVYDFNATLPNNGLNVTSGNFRATSPGQSTLSAALTAKVQMLLGHVGTGAASNGLIGLWSLSYQDQLYSGSIAAVPLPTSIWVGMSGLGLMAGFSWCRRREYNRKLWDSVMIRRRA